MKAETKIEPETKLTKAENRVPAWVLPSVKVSIFLLDAVFSVLCFAFAFVWREGEAIFSPNRLGLVAKDFAPYAGVLFFIVPIRLINVCLSKSLSSAGRVFVHRRIYQNFQSRRGRFAFDYRFYISCFAAVLRFGNFPIRAAFSRSILRLRSSFFRFFISVCAICRLLSENATSI